MSPSPGLADPVQFAASDPLSAPDLLSPEGIHEYLLRAHRISNELQFTLKRRGEKITSEALLKTALRGSSPARPERRSA